MFKFQIFCIPRFQIIQILNVLNLFAIETMFATLGTHLWSLSVAIENHREQNTSSMGEGVLLADFWMLRMSLFALWFQDKDAT